MADLHRGYAHGYRRPDPWPQPRQVFIPPPPKPKPKSERAPPGTMPKELAETFEPPKPLVMAPIESPNPRLTVGMRVYAQVTGHPFEEFEVIGERAAKQERWYTARRCRDGGITTIRSDEVAQRMESVVIAHVQTQHGLQAIFSDARGRTAFIEKPAPGAI